MAESRPRSRAGVRPPRAQAPVVLTQRVAPLAASEPAHGGDGPPSGEADGGRPVHLSRRSLVVLVALAGLGAAALVVLGALTVFGALLAAGAIEL